ncbi:MAG: hypothetical protein ACRD5Z_14885 [Bryobacteraceae bacterium]
MTKLVCPDCRHENEAERIYCHNCGARLDRSALKAKSAPVDSTESTREHLQKMFAADPGRNKRILLRVLKIILGAFCLAVIIQMLLPPDSPVEKKGDAFAPMINMELFTALQSHQPPRLTYSQEQVNGYLASTIRRSNSPAKQGFLPIDRIFVQFEEGVCRVNVRQAFFGFPLSDGSFYRVSVDGGKIDAKNTGGYIGRMPISPFIMRGLGVIFHNTWTTLARDRQSIAKLAGIEFHPQSVTLVTAK